MKLALCNEVLGEMPFEEQCRFSAQLGYQGIELAPYTVDPEPHLMETSHRREIKSTVQDAGTPIAGLHWLLVRPEGLSITTDEPLVRERTIDVMRRLIGLCVDLGGDYLVHGSPAQRRLPEDPAKAAEARKRGIDAWAMVAREAEQAGVYYCIEALAKPQANFVNFVAEAVEIVRKIDSPNIRTMIDCCAVGRIEEESAASLIDQWWPSGCLAHIQVNDTNRRGPGQGKDHFGPVISALKRNDYQGWIGVEPFIYEPDGPSTAAFCAGYLKALIDQV